MNSKRFLLIVKKLPFLLFLCLMLLFPTATLQGASTGLLLWFQKILPVLLPFVIISGLIIRLGLISPISKILYPVLKYLFPVSPSGCYPILIGFLSGLPMGAKTVADLVQQKKINSLEGRYLVCLCNNASPMFILNYIAASELGVAKLGLVLCAILYLSAIFSARLAYPIKPLSILNSSKHYQTTMFATSLDEDKTSQKQPQTSLSTQLDSSILDGFTVVTKIGGYVILFSILSSYLTMLPIPSIFQSVLSCTLEITTGIHQISLLNVSLSVKFFLSVVFTAFGGLSGLAQTQSVIHSSGLSTFFYFKIKLINAAFAASISILYLFILPL